MPLFVVTGSSYFTYSFAVLTVGMIGPQEVVSHCLLSDSLEYRRLFFPRPH